MLHLCMFCYENIFLDSLRKQGYLPFGRNPIFMLRGATRCYNVCIVKSHLLLFHYLVFLVSDFYFLSSDLCHLSSSFHNPSEVSNLDRINRTVDDCKNPLFGIYFRQILFCDLGRYIDRKDV